MLVEKKEVVKVLEEKEVYKIIVRFPRDEKKDILKFSLSLNGSTCSANSSVDGCINHRPTQEEIDKAIELLKNSHLKETMEKYKWVVEVKKLKIKKVEKTIIKTEKINAIEKKWEDA